MLCDFFLFISFFISIVRHRRCADTAGGGRGGHGDQGGEEARRAWQGFGHRGRGSGSQGASGHPARDQDGKVPGPSGGEENFCI